jgi:hypothetical protein
MVRGSPDVAGSGEPAIVRVEVGPDFGLAFESVAHILGDAESRPVALMTLNDSHAGCLTNGGSNWGKVYAPKSL